MSAAARPDPHPTQSPPAFPWAFFLIAYGFTWLVCLPGVLAKAGVIQPSIPDIALMAVAQFGSSLAAFFLVWRSEGWAGVKRLARRAFDFRIPLAWLIPTLLAPPVLAGAALALYRAAGGELPALELLSQPAAIVPAFLFIFFLQGPVPEEFGWRGYALDRLQARWNALVSSLVLGSLWALWHLPLFFMAGAVHSLLPFWAFFFQVTASAVLVTWLYNNTSGNLLVALLFHTMVNLSNGLFPPWGSFLYLMALYVVAAGLVVAIWGPGRLRRG